METHRTKVIKIGEEHVGKRDSDKFINPSPSGRRKAEQGTTIRGEAWVLGGRSEAMPKKEVYRIKKTGLGYTWLPLYRTRVALAEWNMGRKIKDTVRRSGKLTR